MSRIIPRCIPNGKGGISRQVGSECMDMIHMCMDEEDPRNAYLTGYFCLPP
jgi:hypothetical protein